MPWPSGNVPLCPLFACLPCLPRRVEHSHRMLPEASTGCNDPSRFTPGVPVSCSWTPHTPINPVISPCFSDSKAMGCPDPSVIEAITVILCCRAQSGPHRLAFQRQAMHRRLFWGTALPRKTWPWPLSLGSSSVSQAGEQMQLVSLCSF